MFSILIPTWNNLALLQLCVRSILQNSHAATHQIIVHVNDGADGTLAWVKAQGLDYTHSEGNIGICYAVNESSRLAKHDLVLYLNDDMYCCPDWDKPLIEAAQSMHQSNQSLYMLSGTLIEPIESGNTCVVVANFGRDTLQFDEASLLASQHTLQRGNWWGSTWPPTLVSRLWWDRLGGYSSEFSPGMSSDNDFAMKLWAAGCRTFVGLGNSLTYHFMSKSTGKIRKNNGSAQFLHKWGVRSSSFDRYYLRRGEKISEISTPLPRLPEANPPTIDIVRSRLKQAVSRVPLPIVLPFST